MKKVIVLGSNGQLGKTIKDLSNIQGLEFHFFSRNALDITNKSNLSKAFLDSSYDYCVNCAAYTNVEAAETDIENAFSVNAEAVNLVAEVCLSHKVKLIHISTDYVFDGNSTKPYKTTDSANPINQYGKSKRQGELNIQNLLQDYYIIRTSWLYSLHGKNFLKTIMAKVEANATLKITTEEEGTPTSCLDLAEFIIHIIETDAVPYGLYHFSANGSTTWYGFAKEIVNNLDPRKQHQIQPTETFKTLATRPKYSVLDLSKTEQHYKKLNTWQSSVSAMLKKT